MENLLSSAAVRNELLTAFIRFRGDAANTPAYAAISPSAVGGISPGSLFYAFDPSSSTYWAAASFYPIVAASRTLAAVGFQDGGADAIFVRPLTGGKWVVESVGPCHSGLPAPVARTWGLQNPTACSDGSSFAPPTTAAGSPNLTAPPVTNATTPAESPACSSDSLSGTAYQASGAGGQEAVVVVLTSRAPSACVIDGYPTAWFVGASGQRLPGSLVHEATPPPSPVKLLPGGSASTTIWTGDPGVSSSSYCQPATAAGVVVVPPRQTSGISARVAIAVYSQHDVVGGLF